jgi:hypothetical protein
MAAIACARASEFRQEEPKKNRQSITTTQPRAHPSDEQSSTREDLSQPSAALVSDRTFQHVPDLRDPRSISKKCTAGNRSSARHCAKAIKHDHEPSHRRFNSHASASTSRLGEAQRAKRGCRGRRKPHRDHAPATLATSNHATARKARPTATTHQAPQRRQCIKTQTRLLSAPRAITPTVRNTSEARRST